MATIDKLKIKAENLNGAYGEIANLLGTDAALKLHAKYRGTQIFFPVELLSRDFIATQIVEEYNGHNVRDLAIKYGYTEKWVRKLIRENAYK